MLHVAPNHCLNTHLLESCLWIQFFLWFFFPLLEGKILEGKGIPLYMPHSTYSFAMNRVSKYVPTIWSNVFRIVCYLLLTSSLYLSALCSRKRATSTIPLCSSFLWESDNREHQQETREGREWGQRIYFAGSLSERSSGLAASLSPRSQLQVPETTSPHPFRLGKDNNALPHCTAHVVSYTLVSFLDPVTFSNPFIT